MNKEELRQILGREGIREDVYQLEGGLDSEAYTLEKEDEHWSVYYSERGLKSGKVNFPTESEACEHLLAMIREDPTTRADAPEITPEKIFGILRNERIRKADGHWFVAWTDYPYESKETEFDTEGEAEEFLWAKITNRPAI
jgi:hypothetical protein